MDNLIRFFVSAREGNLHEVASLIDGGINVNSENPGGATALEMAAESGQTEMVKFLVEQGGRIDPVEIPCFSSALITAATNHHVEVVKLLLESGADPNVVDSEGQTALMWAAFHDSPIAIIDLLTSHGTDLALTDAKGNTAMEYAKAARNEGIYVLLRERKERIE